MSDVSPCLYPFPGKPRKMAEMEANQPPEGVPQPVPTENSPSSPTVPEPPPAARIVTEAEWQERENEMRRQIEAERESRRAAEVKASYAEDEARRLKEIQSQAPSTKRKVQTVGFWEVDEEEKEN